MSRHRNVRSLDYQEEYDGYDDVYGHSVEDDFCASPSTAQYMFDRTGRHPLASYIEHDEDIPEEEEVGEERRDSLTDSSGFVRPKLSQVDEARLNSCIEEIQGIIGDSTPEQVLVQTILSTNFDHEKALNQILNQQEAPKPQREPRANRRNRGRGAAAAEPAVQNTEVGNVEPPAATTVIAITPSKELNEKVTRMTFSSGSKTQSGFTPEKVAGSDTVTEDGQVSSARRNLNMGSENVGSRDAESLPPAEAPAPEALTDRRVSCPVELLGTPKKEVRSASPTPKTPAKSQQDRMNAKMEYEKRKGGGKDYINLVVIGHVDAGKSTMMGHVLYQLGFVNKRAMHKYEQESKKLGKASFAYAWVLDETEEERSRGVTMDVAQTRFETSSKIVTLLDAPGHKDFIPNMITGAAQADVAILVVNATRGEFETGFEAGGQTREHAMLIRSLGVSQLLVAVNKMDTVDWAEDRFLEVTKKLGAFLRQTGFKESDIVFVPCSGLTGQNLTSAPTEDALSSWYKGGTLVEGIDKFRSPERPVEKPFRMCVTDVFKGMGSGVSVSGTLQAGSISPGDKVLVMPQGEVATVKSASIDEMPAQYVFAGDNSVLVLTGIEMINLAVGSILCEPSSPIPCSSRIQARVVIFNIDIPITKGFPVVFHYQSMSEPAQIKRLISQLHKSTGEVVRSKPRCLTKNTSALIELEISRPVCIELYKDYRDLGRFMLRSAGHTVAAGLVTEIKSSKMAKADA